MSKFRVLLTDYAWPDLDIEQTLLHRVGAELVVADTTEVDRLATLAADCDAILTCWAQIPETVIAAAPGCRIVARLGIGLDNIDIEACSQRSIPVTNVPNYCTREVAEHSISLALALARNIGRFHHETKQGIYDLSAAPTLRRVAGRTFGIVGMGAIGSATAQLASAIGMRVIASSRTLPPAAGVIYVDRAALWAESDFVSLHLPLVANTRHLVNRDVLAQMKPTAFLINTARGGLVDQTALAAALATGEIAGAALDVQEPEPPDLSQPLFKDDRVIVTPHAGFTSLESLQELRTRAVGQVIAALQGESPANIVNLAALAKRR